MRGIRVQSLGQEDPLETGMANHSSILAWRIPWTEKSGRLWSMRSQRVRHGWVTNTFNNLLFPSMKPMFCFHCIALCNRFVKIWRIFNNNVKHIKFKVLTSVFNSETITLIKIISINTSHESFLGSLWKWKWKWSLSRVRLCASPWTVVHQAPPSMGFSRQEYWNELPFPSPGIEPRSSTLLADGFTVWATRKFWFTL